MKRLGLILVVVAGLTEAAQAGAPKGSVPLPVPRPDIQEMEAEAAGSPKAYRAAFDEFCKFTMSVFNASNPDRKAIGCSKPRVIFYFNIIHVPNAPESVSPRTKKIDIGKL